MRPSHLLGRAAHAVVFPERGRERRNLARGAYHMNTRTFDLLIVSARVCTLGTETSYGLIEDGAVGCRDGNIVFAGKMADLPGAPADLANEVIDARDALLTPALIDCHTHLVFGGDRAGEFEQRLHGASYEEIARAGGGIVSSVQATRAASEDALFDAALPRARALRDDGVATLEIKSGYGLDLDNELKMLRVARRIGWATGQQVRTTFLAAHALPPEYAGRADAYIDAVCDEMLPAAASEGLVDAVDAFCERIGFSPAQTRRVFERARDLGLPVKLHADQLSDLGGAGAGGGIRQGCRPTTSNTPVPRASRRWPNTARWRCCCPARSCACAKPRCHRSTRSAPPAWPWRWRRTRTRAPRRCCRCVWR
jgi:imidazolonepropionase